MKILSFSPTTDWFFCFKDRHDKQQDHRLAGFAVIETEPDVQSVVGMVPFLGGGESKLMPGRCELALVPKVLGTYRHASELKAQSSESKEPNT